jgi:hypothetical protein
MEVPEMVFVAELEPIHEERIEDPGARTSTVEPKLESILEGR